MDKNPYETNGPVEVPDFMKNEKKEDVDMSIFKLKDEEIEEDEEELEEEDEERKPLKKETLITIIVAAVLTIALIVTAGMLIAKSKALATAQSTIETQKTSYETKITKLEKEVENLTTENTTLKEENEKLKKEAEYKGGTGSGETTGEASDGTLTAGNYKIAVGMYIRKSPDSSAEKVQVSDLPQAIKEIANDNCTMVVGSTVKVTEVKTVSGNVWGKIADNAWICLKNGTDKYYE